MATSYDLGPWKPATPDRLIESAVVTRGSVQCSRCGALTVVGEAVYRQADDPGRYCIGCAQSLGRGTVSA